LYTASTDPSYDAAPINLWSFIEINIGILCASGPQLKQLYKRVKALLTPKRVSSSGDASSRKEEKGNARQFSDSPPMYMEQKAKLVPRTEVSVSTTCIGTYSEVENKEWVPSHDRGISIESDKTMVNAETTQSRKDMEIKMEKCWEDYV
jgi:hypothetical protein